MLEELRGERRCAFCSLEHRELTGYFEGLLYEKVTDPGIRGALVKSRGFCPRHAHVLVTFGDGLGTAILYADQIELRLKLLEEHGPRRGRPRARSARTGEDSCPACRTEARLRASHIRALLQGLGDPEMSAAFEASAGLCFPHFSAALREAEDPGARKELIRVQKQKMEALLSQLKKLIDRYDYRNIGAGFAEEKDSWIRAVEAVSGLKDLF